jgi:hypothetical protein
VVVDYAALRREWSGGAVDELGCNSYGDDTDDEDKYSVYSNEARLERAYESDEDLELGCNPYGDNTEDEDYYYYSSDTEYCSGEAVGERGCKCWYKESADEVDIDQVDAPGLKELLDRFVDDESAGTKELLDRLLDDESDQAAFDLDMREMLDRLERIAHRREAKRNSEGVYGGYSDYGYGGGGGYGVASDYYRGQSGGYRNGYSDYGYGGGGGYGVASDYYRGQSGGYRNGISDYGYGGSGRNFDYGRGEFYDGGVSDFDFGDGRGYYGGISDYDYSYGGRAGYRAEGYYGNRYHVPAYAPRSSPATDRGWM